MILIQVIVKGRQYIYIYIYIYVPTRSITKGFIKEWKEVKKEYKAAVNSALKTTNIKPFFKEFKDFKYFEDVPNNVQESILVFDEVHLVQSKF